MLLTDGNRKAAQQLWLRKVRIHREAPPDAGASAPKAATAKPQPAPARARAVPKLETAAQLARRERSQIRLRQKHLASKMWATIRIASRLLAWRRRAHLRPQATELVSCALATWLAKCCRCDERDTSNWTSDRNAAVAASMCSERRMPILVGRLLIQQWPSVRDRHPRSAEMPAPSTSSTAAAQPPPALALAPPPPPSQPPPSALAAAARAALDACV